MKVYISVDIEGTAGIASWSATNLGDPEHRAAAQEMTLEAVAACQGALDAGATELYVKDAHDSGRNMDSQGSQGHFRLDPDPGLHGGRAGRFL